MNPFQSRLDSVLAEGYSIHRFSDLALPFQKAIVWFMAVDGDAWDRVELPSTGDAEAFKSALWELLPQFVEHYGGIQHGGPMGAAVWKSLYAVVTQRDASVWIDNRERGFSHYTIEREAGCFARGFDGLALGATIYSQIRKSGAYRIAEIEKSCPVTLPSQEVAS